MDTLLIKNGGITSPMNSHFSVAHLTPEHLVQIQQFEKKLSSDTNENIVLIAYTDHDSDQRVSPASE